MGDYIAYERGMADGALHPVIQAMNVLGFDCGTLGNHEFNYGVEFMDKVVQGAEFPIVCANFVNALGATGRQDDMFLRPYTLVDREIIDGAGGAHAIKIGLIGFLPRRSLNWDKRHLEGKFNARGHPAGGPGLGARNAGSRCRYHYRAVAFGNFVGTEL